MSEKNNGQQFFETREVEEGRKKNPGWWYTCGGGTWPHRDDCLRYFLYLCESVKWAGHQHDIGLPTYEDVLMMNAMATRNVTL